MTEYKITMTKIKNGRTYYVKSSDRSEYSDEQLKNMPSFHKYTILFNPDSPQKFYNLDHAVEIATYIKSRIGYTQHYTNFKIEEF